MTRAKQLQRWSACGLIIWVVIFHCFRTQGQTTPAGYAQAVTNNSPFAYWRLNETNGATVAEDFFGVYNGAIGSGVTAGVPGPQSSAFPDFETNNTAMRLKYNSSSYLTMPVLNLNTNTVTITGWINPTGFQASWAGVVFCRGGTTVAGLNFGPGSIANELRYTWNNDRYYISTGLVVPTNQWSFFALVVTPGGATIYLGTSGALSSFTDTTGLPSQAFDASLLLGFDPSSSSRLLNGMIDEVALYNYALSPSQIQQLYPNAGSGQTNEPVVPFIYPFDPTVSRISVAPSTNWGVFHESDTITISTSNNLPIRVTTIRGVVVYSGAPTSFQLGRGHYFVECNGDRNQFCVLPSDYQGASFVGTDASNGDTAYSQRLAQIHPAWVPTGAGMWYLVQPQANVWDWSGLDNILASNPGTKIISVAFYRPDWVTDSNFLTNYLQYVKQMAQRYDGRIYAIQVWNEPWVTTVTANGRAWGSIANPCTGNMAVDLPVFYQTLANLLVQASAAIRSVSSSIKVFGPNWSDPFYTTDTASLAQDGGIAALDMFTFHGNSLQPPDGPMIPGVDCGYTSYIDLIKPSLGSTPWMVPEFHAFGGSALGVSNPPCALDGLTVPSGVDWYRGMCRNIKTVVLWRAKGAQGILQFLLTLYAEADNPNYELYGWEHASLGQPPRGPHPKTSAYLMSAYWLNNATFVDYRDPGQICFLYAWRMADNSSVVFSWALEGQTVTLLPLGLTATDIYGNNVPGTTLTEEPVLFRSTTLSPAALLSNVLAAVPTSLDLAPVLQTIPTENVLKGASLQFTVAATDPNNYPVTYSVTPLPPGASFNPATGAFSWTPNATQTGTYQLTFTTTDARGLSTSASTTINVLNSPLDGLINWWKFDATSGVVAVDSMGTNTGTLTNFPFNGSSAWVTGLVGNALSFNGTNDYVSLDSSKLSLTNNFTIACWLNPRNVSAIGQAFIAVRSLSPNGGLVGGGLRCYVSTNSLLVQGVTSLGWQGATFANGAIVNGVWQHVAIVYDKSTLTVYLNGVSQGSVLWGGDLVMNPNYPCSIGAGNQYYFNGAMDDVRIYNRTMTAAEVLSLYQSMTQTPVPTGPLLPYEQTVTNSLPYAFWRLNETNGAVAFDYFGSYDGTINPGVTLGVNGPQDPPFVGFGTNNTAMLLIGATNSFLTMPQLNLNTNAVTITGLINPTGIEPASAGVVFCRGGTTAAGINFGPGSNNELRYTWNGARTNISTGLIVPTNQWSYFALVVSPTNAMLYVGINGILNSFTHSVIETNQAFDAPLLIGSDAGATNRLFIGGIADIALYKGTLTSSQLQLQYNAAAVCTGTPVITNSPTNQTVVAGSNAMFTVQATGAPPLLYQWQSSVNNGSTWSTLSGATNTSYTTSALVTNNSGTQFRAIVSGSCGSPATSSVAVVSVTSAPVVIIAYAQTVAGNGPFAYWRLNETNGATVAHDFYGVYNGTIGAAVTAGVIGPQAPAFPGFETTNTAMRLNTASGSYLTMPALFLNTNTVTITGWINPNGYQSGWAGVVFCRGGTTVSGVNFGSGSPGNELRYTWNNNRYNVSTGLIVPTNQWSFFALVVTPNGATMYLGTNGVLNSHTDTTSLPSQAFDGSLLLGFDPSSGSRLFNGVVDEVAVFNHSLSPAQIQQLYNSSLVAPPLLGVSPASYNFGALATGTTAQISFVVTNIGGGTLTGTVATAGPFAVVSGGSYSVPSAGSTNVVVSFTPPSPGSFSNRVIFTTNGGVSTNLVTGTGVTPPYLSISQGNLNYGSLVIGQTSNQFFSVINTGQVTLTGTAAVGLPFAAASNASYTVAGGATGLVLISFSPSAAGAVASNVVFTSTGGVSTNAVAGTGLMPAHLIVNPASLNFGTIPTGTTAQASFVVTNSGGALLSGTAAAGGAFAVSSGSPYNIPGFSATNVVINFSPLSVGSFSTNVVVTSNGGNSTNAVTGSGAAIPVALFSASPTTGAVPLTVTFTDNSTGTLTNRFWDFGDGATSNLTLTTVAHTYSTTGTYTVSLTVNGPLGNNTSTQVNLIVAVNPPQLMVSPASQDFGTVVVGQTSNRFFSVINTGDLMLTGSATVAGSPYAITAGSPFTVAAGQTQTVTVAFAPVADGTFSTNLIVASNGGASTNALTGIGMTPAQLAVSPMSWDFGAVATGGVAYASFAATNSGGASLSGTASVGFPFAVVTNASFSLAGFASTNVVVQFAPPTAGTWTSNIVFTSTGGSSTNVVTGVGAVEPLALFSASPTNGAAPLTVTFTDNSTGTITNRFWDFGDGATTNTVSTSVLHTYYAAGTDTVILSVSGPLGASLATNIDSIIVTNIITLADLTLGADAAPSPVPQGQTLTYTLAVTNFGPDTAPTVTVTDVLPASLVFLSATTTQGNCTNSNGIISCDLGDMASLSNAIITIVGTAPPPGVLTNVAIVTVPTLDPILTNNAVTNVTLVTPAADLVITATNTPNPVLTSQNLTYSLTVSNLGPASATSVTVTDALPTSVSFVSATMSAGSVTNMGGVVICALGSLTSNATATITIVGAPTAAVIITNIVNVATVFANEFDPAPSNNSASVVAVVYLDSVGDGIPDWWRAQYFDGNGTNTSSVSCASCDADGTGQNNLFKYVAGLDPTNPASVFTLQVVPQIGQPTWQNLLFSPQVAGRTYTALFSTDLVSGVWLPLAGIVGPVTNGNQVTITDTNAIQPQEFYRLQISQPTATKP